MAILTQTIKIILDFRNGLIGTANQNLRQSRQTGSWVVSQQMFDGFKAAFTQNPVLRMSKNVFCSFYLLYRFGQLIAVCSYINLNVFPQYISDFAQ